MREDAAGTAKKKLEEASDAGIQNRKWWEEVGDWVTDNWDTIVAVCKVVVAVLGVIAMIIGGPILGAIVLIAALVVLADTLNKYANGEAPYGRRLRRPGLHPRHEGPHQPPRPRQGHEGPQGRHEGDGKGLKERAAARAGHGPADEEARSSAATRSTWPPARWSWPRPTSNCPACCRWSSGARHRSSVRSGRWFGPSWSSTIDQRLDARRRRASQFATEDGMLLHYPRPAPGASVMPVEGPRLAAGLGRRPGRRAHASPTRTPATPATSGRCTGRPRPPPCRSHAITRPQRQHHRLRLRRRGAPTAIRHSGGYHLAVDRENAAHHRARPGRVGIRRRLRRTPSMRYGYDEPATSIDVYQLLRPAAAASPTTTRAASRRGPTATTPGTATPTTTRTAASATGGAEGTSPTPSPTTSTDPDGHATAASPTPSATTTRLPAQRRAASSSPRPTRSGGTVRTEWDRPDQLLSATDALGHTTRVRVGRRTATVTVTPARTAPRPPPPTTTSNLPVRVIGPGRRRVAPGVRRARQPHLGHRARRRDHQLHPRRDRAPDLGHRRRSAHTTRFATTRRGCRSGSPIRSARSPATACDAFGRPRTTHRPDGRHHPLAWTVEGQARSPHDPDGATESWTYDGEGNCTSHTDAVGARHPLRVHALRPARGPHRPRTARATSSPTTPNCGSRVTNPQGLTWDYEYDAAGPPGLGDGLRRPHADLHPRRGGPARRPHQLRSASRSLRARRAGPHQSARMSAGQRHHLHLRPAGQLTEASGPGRDAHLRAGRPRRPLLSETVDGRT